MSAKILSLCMIVKDGAGVLGRCLDSASSLDPEIVVVDTGSTDDTAEIAARFGAKVIRFDFTFVDFAAARNRALLEARGQWIVVLDADETLQPSSVPLIHELCARDANAGY
jgi:glycosyltransferase involved in cell wall biosynthesis